MKTQIEINMDNAAFGEYPANELARILRALANRLEDGGMLEVLEPLPLRDLNGNRVGYAVVVSEEVLA